MINFSENEIKNLNKELEFHFPDSQIFYKLWEFIPILIYSCIIGQYYNKIGEVFLMIGCSLVALKAISWEKN